MRKKQRVTVASSLQGFLPRKAVLMARKAGSKAVAEVPVRDPEVTSRAPTLEALGAEICSGKGCQKCRLATTRSKIVVGEGAPKARLVFVGEGPGAQEDLTGRPFVGRAGQLLEKMIGAIGLKRSDVYICNVVKCRPPENRNPMPDEIEACSPYLFRQLELIRPELVVALGKFAAQTLLKTETPISKLRSQVYDYRGTKLLATFHPSYLLRNPPAKKEAWEDLKQVAKILRLSIPTPPVTVASAKTAAAVGDRPPI